MIDLVYRLGRVGNFDSFGRLPIPWEQALQFAALCASGYDALEHVGQPCQRIDAVKLAALCRAANYAEQARFCQPLSWPSGSLIGIDLGFSIAVDAKERRDDGASLSAA